jgi:mRNA interferase MazF
MRGDVVLVDFPFSDGSASKRRPALLVQSDNVVSVNEILLPITSNVSRIGPTRLVVDPAVEPGTGLRTVSAVACENPFSVHRSLIVKRIGSLGAASMAKVDECLKLALGLL